jgi:hypothetical protein
MQVVPGVHTELSAHDPPAATGVTHCSVALSQRSPGPQALLEHEALTPGAASHVPHCAVRGIRQ